jgi:hypothetical protein
VISSYELGFRTGSTSRTEALRISRTRAHEIDVSNGLFSEQRRYARLSHHLSLFRQIGFV